ncbi:MULTISPECIES: hypothetical protein [Acinetobacter]|jgi:neutral trehalase|nr:MULTISPECIES: hypothetical protein [Acinetobacter]WLF74156.1 hypothetical protein Q4617_17125 [Acinetobacter junii]
MIRPYPPLFKIYQSYAQILNASQLPTHFQHDVSLISATAPAPAELFATDNFLLVYIAQQQNIRIKARSIVEADVDLIQVQYQLSNTLFKLMTELKINPQALNPDKLLHNLNQSLSKQAIYDVNQKLYDKPRCSLSRDLLAKLIDCSRNQLLYRQKQINGTHDLRIQALKNKCKALTSVQPCASQFWSLDHEN